MPPYQKSNVAKLALLSSHREKKTWLGERPLEGLGVSAEYVCNVCIERLFCSSGGCYCCVAVMGYASPDFREHATLKSVDVN